MKIDQLPDPFLEQEISRLRRLFREKD